MMLAVASDGLLHIVAGNQFHHELRQAVAHVLANGRFRQ